MTTTIRRPLGPRAAIAFGLGAFVTLSLPAPAAAQTISEYSVPTPSSGPQSVAMGPDGALWFTELSGLKIGRMTTDGFVTAEFAVPTASSLPLEIVAGPDGALWFTEESGNKIGRITTAGTVTEFPVPTAGSNPTGIAAGPDGALWFTEGHGQKIGRITTAGTVTEVASTTGFPTDIVAGPDGALWFTEQGGNKIGRITVAGVVTEFPVPTAASGPTGIVAGPDGALWFTENSGLKIGRITTAGTITNEYAITTANSFPEGIVAGSDGALWFTENRRQQDRADHHRRRHHRNRCSHGRQRSGWHCGGTGRRAVVCRGERQQDRARRRRRITETAVPTASSGPTALRRDRTARCGSPRTVATRSGGSPPPAPSPNSPISHGRQRSGWHRGGAGRRTVVHRESTATRSGGSPLRASSPNSRFPRPTAFPYGIAAGPDGALWFTELVGNKIGRITTAGVVITEYTVPTAGSSSVDITAGPDGALWFTEQGRQQDRADHDRRGRHRIPYSHGRQLPVGIAAGPDGALWFTEELAATRSGASPLPVS